MDEGIRKLLDDRAFREYADLTKEREFNAFDVLRYSDYEIRHSNVLAWLLRPGETHGVGDAFLRKVGECLREKEHSGKLKGLDGSDEFVAESVCVKRERDNVDVMVFFKKARILLVIENKVGRRTPDDVEQLRGYVKEQREKHGHSCEVQVQGVLLTASESGDPEHEDYLHLSWCEVRGLVASLLEEGCVCSAEVKQFLFQYIEMVDRNILGQGPSSNSFKRLLANHEATLKGMLPEWKPGVVPACWGLSLGYEDAVDSLLRDFRQRPADLRDRVRGLLQGRGFDTRFSAARDGTAYWLSFWDGCWSELAEGLGLPDLGWWFEFTHRGVAVQLSGGQVTGDQRRAAKRMMRFMEGAPVLDTSAGKFTLRIDTLGYAGFYRHDLLTECAFSDSTREEIEKRTLDEVEAFLDSSDYKRINRYFEVLAFRR